MDIAKIFDEISIQMRSDIDKARTALTHPGLKGLSFEESFRKFMKAYLPNSLNVSTGILFDSKGNTSRQLDIIISDSLKTPIYFKSGDLRVIPVECAYGVIEIKAYLDSKELDNIFNNMLSVRKLEKVAFYKPELYFRGIHTDNLYGKSWKIWPTNYLVFAYDSVNLVDIANNISKFHRDNNFPEHSRIDMVCVLDKGVICNQLEDGTYNALPEPKSNLCVCNTSKALLLFYSLYSRYLFQARIPNFRFTDYLGQMTF
jgi:hypothetical protein